MSVLEATEPPGFGPPIHVHDDAAEAFYVLEGEYFMHLNGDEHRCPAGSFSDGELAQIAESHRMHIVGPPSERYI